MRLRRAAVALTLTGLLGGCAPSPMLAQPSEAAPATPFASSSRTASTSPSPDPVQIPEPAITETPHDPQPTAEPAAEEPSTPDPVALPALYRVGDTDERIREIQHRMLQIGWHEGKITAEFTAEMQGAVEGFQAKRGLPVTGEIDEVTLATLSEMTRMPTADEMHNVLTPGPAILSRGSESHEVRDLQVRLRLIGWYDRAIDGVYGNETANAVAGFQQKRGLPETGEVDQRTLDKLHAMTRKPTKDELNNIFTKPKGGNIELDERCLTGRAICISKRARKLAWVIDGEVQMVMDVRFGASKTPTREGTFTVEWKSRNHHSKLYDSPMPYALFFSRGQAVHFSSDFARRGYRGASHGCVNVRDKGAIQALFSQAREGDKVIVYSD